MGIRFDEAQDIIPAQVVKLTLYIVSPELVTVALKSSVNHAPLSRALLTYMACSQIAYCLAEYAGHRVFGFA